jgi:phosphoglycolate phosphatase (TIGR01487 family)
MPLKSTRVFAIDIDGTLTEDGGGMIHIPALSKLRYLETIGYNVIYVTGRSSVEAYILAVFGGTTKIAIGENGGAITVTPQEHILLANKEECMKGYEILKKNLDGVKIKPVFHRLTEVVLFRTFDIKEGQRVLRENNLDLHLSDSTYAFHINQRGIDKGIGLKEALKLLKREPLNAVAIGDSETDIPLFDICGYSIALDHAQEIVKSRAKHVIKGREGIGLVEAIDFVVYNQLQIKG